MRPVASTLAAAALLAAASCCYGGSGACVVDYGFPRCEPLYDAAEEVCPWSPPELDPPPSSCPGVFHDGADCPGLGYTVRCDGGYYVPPGLTCG